MKKTGLTLGKFAPFHKGHQYLIETAIAEMEEVVVIVYNAEDVTDIPLHVRAGWIRNLYPDVKVVEAHDGPQCTGDTPEIRSLHETYLLERLGIRNITGFYSSEFYGDHVSRALGAANRLVDPDREAVPVSGTMIRDNTYRFREYLDPTVYRDLVTNSVFLGAPSTGKTTLAKNLAGMFATEWMPEYGREYWLCYQKNRKLSKEQLVEIAQEHLVREEQQIRNSNRFLFTDTNALTTWIFSRYYHGGASDILSSLADSAETRYDHFFVCDTDIPCENTWDRSGEVKRQLFQEMILEDLEDRSISYTLISGSVSERMECVSQLIRAKR